ncbi:VCBS repeat-containing protein [Sphingobacterium sp. 1.A.5]|uniref:FG-GAP repeat domain-containing protein n=1 Tax=Sphingobacterium sp. 1.A.5 TaxID=2044604 RepID=UPI000C0BFD76|nr:VCBS repeat-containing protein [Sphingobacterium sp. 1.A.5]
MKKLLLLNILILTYYCGFCQKIDFVNRDGALSIGTQSNRTAWVTLADIDNDGDLDALVANGRHWAEQSYVFFNDGSGNFKSGRPLDRLLLASYCIKAGDLKNSK